jgi:hypothetical protein
VNLEKLQNLIEHLAMLGRNGHYGLDLFRMFFQFQYYRRHLDGLRSGSENSHYLYHTKSSLIEQILLIVYE